ncbi:MAG: hypothetical protein IMW91_00525 [Firmicutes bacterium]|nr:hypothetical protein [Bacillota bacterium]
MKGIWKGSLVGLTAAGVLAAVLVMQPVRSAAQGFLDHFHVHQLTPVAIDPTTLQHLPTPPPPHNWDRFHINRPE